MSALDRRAFMAATAATAVAPAILGAKEIAPGLDWATMSLEQRNLAFNNTLHVGADIVRGKAEAWTAESAQLRAQHPQHLDLPYASGERTKWDLFPAADSKAPCLVHIHGGYWQRNSRQTFSCLSEGVLARGWSAALPGYTLAPDATLTQITQELRTALDWLAANGNAHGIAGPIIISGWSAGGHLTAFLLDHPRVAAGMAISGVFELAPLRDSPHVQDKVKLTETEIESLSPMRLPPANKPLAVTYGTAELPAMIQTSRDYHAYRAQWHLPGPLVPIAKANHFTILDELRSPNSVMTRTAIQLAEDIE
jgi:arylformamidase